MQVQDRSNREVKETGFQYVRDTTKGDEVEQMPMDGREAWKDTCIDV